MSTPNLSFEQWGVLRNLVFEADSPERRPVVPESLSEHPVVALLQRYWSEGQRSFLDQAAREGVSPGDQHLALHLRPKRASTVLATTSAYREGSGTDASPATSAPIGPIS